MTHARRSDIHLLDPDFFVEPRERYAWLRNNAPVYWDETARNWEETGVWGIARYAEIRDVSLNQELFTSAKSSRIDAPPVSSMINRDEPEHMDRRDNIRRRFTPQAVRDYEPFIRRAASRLVDAVIDKGRCDFVADLAKPLPMIVIGELLGLPECDHEKLLAWSDIIATGMSNMYEGFEELSRHAVHEFDEYITYWFEERRENPGDDLISMIQAGEINGCPVTHKDLMQETLLLLIGGDETTRHVLSGGLEALIRNPQQFDKLKSDTGRYMDKAIDECLRWASPVKTIARESTRDVSLGGQQIRKGDKLVLLYESGNRDETVFDQPYDFDIERSPNHHLTFGGFGRHYCLGASLAKLEIRCLFLEILGRLPSIRLVSEDILPRRRGTFVLGIESMPVCW